MEGVWEQSDALENTIYDLTQSEITIYDLTQSGESKTLVREMVQYLWGVCKHILCEDT